MNHGVGELVEEYNFDPEPVSTRGVYPSLQSSELIVIRAIGTPAWFAEKRCCCCCWLAPWRAGSGLSGPDLRRGLKMDLPAQ